MLDSILLTSYEQVTITPESFYASTAVRRSSKRLLKGAFPDHRIVVVQD